MLVKKSCKIKKNIYDNSYESNQGKEKIFVKFLINKKSITSLIKKNIYDFNKNNKNNLFYKNIFFFHKNNKNNLKLKNEKNLFDLNIEHKKFKFSDLLKFSNKCFYERKSLKWYWREKTYDMLDGDVYKHYEIRFKDNFHMELIPKEIYNNNKSYDSCLLWLYDGDFPEYFIEHLLEFNNFPPKNYKIIIFRAPFNPIIYDTAVLQHSWFNIHELPDREGNRDISKNKIDENNKIIHREIKDQYNIVGNYNNIFIGGFSQSACMALYTCMTYKENLGGVIMFSGFNFDFTPIDQEKANIPILAINGLNDETVIIRHARNSYLGLKKNKFNLKFIEETGLYHFFSKSGLKSANDLLSIKKL